MARERRLRRGARNGKAETDPVGFNQIPFGRQFPNCARRLTHLLHCAWRTACYSSRMRIVWRCLLALAVIWSLAAGALLLVQRSRPTPQKFMRYVAEHPLEGLDAPGRAGVIDHAARLLNGLNTEQRRELKKGGVLRAFFTKLNREERRRFAELTLPAGFRQMVKTLNKMDPGQRKTVVARTLRDLRRQSAVASELSGEDDIREMLSGGSAIFEAEANPQVKLDFAPVIEELRQTQKNPAVSVAPPK